MRIASLLAAAVVAVLLVFTNVAPSAAADEPFVLHVPVLMYHRILCPDSDTRLPGLFVCPALLDAQMAELKRQGWHTITTDKLVDDMTQHVCPRPKTFVITDDDGALDGYTNGAPIWERYGFRATFAMVVGKAGDYHTDPLVPKPHFDWDQARDLISRGFGIANHTMFHDSVASMDDEQLEVAVQQAQDILGQELGFYPNIFVYPLGAVGGDEVTEYLADRFALAFTTAAGATESSATPMRSPRIRVAGKEQPAGIIAAINKFADPCSPPPSAQAAISPRSHDFGTVAPNAHSTPTPFIVTNSGGGTVNVTDVDLDGGDADQFSVTNNECAGAALGPQASCGVDVEFSPTSEGSKAARLEVTTDAPVGGSLEADLSGTAATPLDGSITIRLVSHPAFDQPIAFTGSPGIAPFTLDDKTGTGDETTFAEPAGTYEVVASEPKGWSFATIACDAPEATDESKALVTITLAAGEQVSCTFTVSQRLPDAAIADSPTGPFSGAGIYSNRVRAAQTVTQHVARRHTTSLYVKLTNNGTDRDTFVVAGKLRKIGTFRVSYVYNGDDVTRKVAAGQWSFSLAPGGERIVEVRVTAGGRSTVSNWAHIDVTFRSATAAARDVVRGCVIGQ